MKETDCPGSKYNKANHCPPPVGKEVFESDELLCIRVVEFCRYHEQHDQIIGGVGQHWNDQRTESDIHGAHG